MVSMWIQAFLLLKLVMINDLITALPSLLTFHLLVNINDRLSSLINNSSYMEKLSDVQSYFRTGRFTLRVRSRALPLFIVDQLPDFSGYLMVCSSLLG